MISQKIILLLKLYRSVNNRSKTKQKSRYLKVVSTFLFGLQTDFYQIELSRVRVVWKLYPYF